MTTNQEGLHATVRALTSTTRSYNEDWHALFDADGIAAGTFNERMLAWINATLGTSYTNLNGAMQAFAVDQGFANWASMDTFVTSLASFLLSRYGPYGMVMDFTDASISINDSTDVLDYSSQGTISESTGALLGPGSKLVYSAPSAKLTEQADGYLAFQAHNLCLRSNDTSNAAWIKTNLTVGSAVTAPTGEQAYVLYETITNGAHVITPNSGLTTVSGAKYAISALVKGEGRDWVYLGYTESGTSTRIVYFNVTGAGSVGTTGLEIEDAAIDHVSDGWYRCSFVATDPLASNINQRIGTASADGVSSFAGDTGKGLYVTEIQVRRTPSVSTYVATTSAAVYDLPYVFSGGVRTGILVEPAATNLALRSNDFTNASWTKSNLTAALTATGPDNVANSASTLTATAGNATALQAITSASSSRVTSVYIKRRTGSGNIDLTQDNGSTWTTQTVTSSWTRVALASVTSTNPTVGIRIVTSGDEVDVYCFDHETGTVATSPIITYGASVVRAVDNISMSTTLFPWVDATGSWWMTITPLVLTNGVYWASVSDGTVNNLVSHYTTAGVRSLQQVTTGGVSQVNSIASASIVIGTKFKHSAAWENNNFGTSVNGGAVVSDATGTLPTGLTTLTIGARTAGSANSTILLQNFCYVNRRWSDAELVLGSTL